MINARRSEQLMCRLVERRLTTFMQVPKVRAAVKTAVGVAVGTRSKAALD